MARAYTKTVADLLTQAREILNDTRTDVGYRHDDAKLIRGLNEALQAAVGIAPGLFVIMGTHTCAAGAEQVIETARAAALMSCMSLPECDLATLTAFAPGWMADTPGTPQNWMRAPGDTLRFYVDPPAAGGESITVRIAQTPATLAALSDIVPLPENYAPALVEYIVGRAELADDEHVNTGRAATLLERFAASIKVLGG